VVRLRLLAVIEILACSGLPTQLAIAGALAAAGVAPFDAHGPLAARYVYALSLIDAAVVVGLVAFFLRAHGERATRVLLGDRPKGREAALGLIQVPAVFIVAAAVMLGLAHYVPWLHNVTTNPFEGLVGTPADAALFSVVAIVGGGVREEVQRAFILHRFDQVLGGGWVGLVLSSLAFGLGHLMQGRDVAVTTALLGACWGFVYLRRRSVVSTVVSHSGFNAAEIFRILLVRG
jgi:membrane protease YdiL (CAAX protease family)